MQEATAGRAAATDTSPANILYINKCRKTSVTIIMLMLLHLLSNTYAYQLLDLYDILFSLIIMFPERRRYFY